MKVLKYPLQGKDLEMVMMPYGAKVLTAQNQGGKITLWALVDEDAHHMHGRYFRIVATGETFKGAPDYIATVQQGVFVWHVFEE